MSLWGGPLLTIGWVRLITDPPPPAPRQVSWAIRVGPRVESPSVCISAQGEAYGLSAEGGLMEGCKGTRLWTLFPAGVEGDPAESGLQSQASRCTSSWDLRTAPAVCLDSSWSWSRIGEFRGPALCDRNDQVCDLQGTAQPRGVAGLSGPGVSPHLLGAPGAVVPGLSHSGASTQGRCLCYCIAQGWASAAALEQAPEDSRPRPRADSRMPHPGGPGLPLSQPADLGWRPPAPRSGGHPAGLGAEALGV